MADDNGRYRHGVVHVVKVRKEQAERHRHIEGVITPVGEHYTRREAVDSINARNTWQTNADGYSATTSTLTCCQHLPIEHRTSRSAMAGRSTGTRGSLLVRLT